MNEELKDILTDIIMLIIDLTSKDDSPYCDKELINRQATELFKKINNLEVNNNE